MSENKDPFLKGADWLDLLFLLPSAAGMIAILTIPFLAINFDSANQIIGRIFFAIPTLFMDLIKDFGYVSNDC